MGGSEWNGDASPGMIAITSRPIYRMGRLALRVGVALFLVAVLIWAFTGYWIITWSFFLGAGGVIGLKKWWSNRRHLLNPTGCAGSHETKG